MKKMKTLSAMLMFAGAAQLLGACGLLEDFGNSWGMAVGLSCTSTLSGTPGTWWAANVALTVPSPSWFSVEGDPCTTLICVPTEGATDAVVRAIVAGEIGHKPDDLSIQVSNTGLDLATKFEGINWNACVFVKKPQTNCAHIGEECDPLTGAPDQCCDSAVCHDLGFAGVCCVDVGNFCTSAEECCEGSLGCILGTCACIPSGQACTTETCCNGPCNNGKCCAEVAFPCETDADCCAPLKCALNVCD